MATWGALLQELNKVERELEKIPPSDKTESPQDILRRRYLKKLSDYTKRPAIIYATPWLEPSPGGGDQRLQVVPGDVQGFMEAVSNLDGDELDLFLTSPGGSAEAAESIMAYLRTRFAHIRAVVPVAAMSAATMMGLACDQIVMGTHSQLGPIDPQFTIMTPEGPRSAPGQAILDQFERAKEECSTNPGALAAWLPILRGYLPGLLEVCVSQRKFAEEFAEKALTEHMFRDDPDGPAKAAKAAKWFSDFKEFKSHGRRVGVDEAEKQGLDIVRLEDDQQLQDLVLSVHHATRLTFGGTPTVKIIENSKGRGYFEMNPGFVIQGPVQPPAQVGPGQGQVPRNRAEQRRQERDQNKRKN